MLFKVGFFLSSGEYSRGDESVISPFWPTFVVQNYMTTQWMCIQRGLRIVKNSYPHFQKN